MSDEDQAATVGNSAGKKLEYQVCSPGLPLAVYRAVAAHLRQVDGVETGLLPQLSTTFDYYQSQVGGLWIRYPADTAAVCQPQVEQILAYYGERFKAWETINP